MAASTGPFGSCAVCMRVKPYRAMFDAGLCKSCKAGRNRRRRRNPNFVPGRKRGRSGRLL